MGSHGSERPERRHSDETAQRWAAELLARMRSATGPEDRSQVLRELERPYLLDEDSALELYRLHPRLTSVFIARHAPKGRRAEDARLPWTRLMREALGQGDEALHFALYRAQMPADQWARDTMALARRVASREQLCEELDRRHPQRWRADIGPHLVALAQERGEHLLPYLERHVSEVWSVKRRAGRAEMAQLARRRGWWELWAALALRCASPAEYDAEVLALVQDRTTPEAQVRQQLLQLAGTPASGDPDSDRSRALKDGTLLALYERFPHYVRGPFRGRLAPSLKQPRTALLERAIEQRDDELIDLLASHLAVYQPRSGDAALVAAARVAAEYYASRPLDDSALAARAARILRRVPPGTIRSMRELDRKNPLARTLLAKLHAAAHASPETLAELLGAQDRHVFSVGLEALARAGIDASLFVDDHLDVLLDALTRTVNRPAARLLLAALRGVGTRDTAARVLARIRERLAQPVTGLSREALAAAAGDLLQRFPVLRAEAEQPVVYRRRVA
jgi:hypothetical protein